MIGYVTSETNDPKADYFRDLDGNKLNAFCMVEG